MLGLCSSGGCTSLLSVFLSFDLLLQFAKATQRDKQFILITPHSEISQFIEGADLPFTLPRPISSAKLQVSLRLLSLGNCH